MQYKLLPNVLLSKKVNVILKRCSDSLLYTKKETNGVLFTR